MSASIRPVHPCTFAHVIGRSPQPSEPASASSSLPEHEARFLALERQLIPMLDGYDRLWAPAGALYEAWQRATARHHRWRQATHEDISEWHAYRAAREPADALELRIVALVGSLVDRPMTSVAAILLRCRYSMSFEAFREGVLEDLNRLWEARS